MNIGKITGFKIGKNRDGDKDRVLLQVEMIEGEDTRTIELISQSGEDTNPGNGCRAVVVDYSSSCQVCIAITDDLLPEVEPGEKEFYSTDSPVTAKLARLKLTKDSEIILNEGSDNPVKWSELNTIMQTFITALNAVFATKLNGSGSAGGLTLNLTTAKSPKVFIP